MQTLLNCGEVEPHPAAILAGLLPDARHEETHLSHVFITDQDVYKLKKPLDLGFCDYTSIDARRDACRQEVLVNRRLADGLYRGVVPLTREGGAFTIDGTGPVIDWLVHMRPFAMADRGDRAMANGRISPRKMRDFVDQLYAVHAETGHCPDDPWAARVAELARTVAADVVEAATTPALKHEVLALEQQLAEQIATHRALLGRRGAHAILATAHGDLHLQNLVLIEGEVIAYDALEFDPELTRIDGFYDIAFLVMDLWHHGHEATAHAVMNRYLALDGHYAAIVLMPIYGALRAMIRAMAALLRNDAKAGEAYLQTAKAFLTPADKPEVIFISGRSGTGKTSAAQALASTLRPPPGALHLRSDVLRKRRAGKMPEEPLPQSAYSEAAHRDLYAAYMEIVACLRGQWPVIADIALAGTAPPGADDAAQLSDHRFWLDAPDDVLAARLSARKGDASDATAKVMEQQRQTPPGHDWKVVSAAGTINDTVSEIQNSLDKRHQLSPALRPAR